ncbi:MULTISPECIES: hypothetical protein [Arthrobacter]|uniref:DUF2269 family protein n=1 Tax=Arthrobacter oryzae TaxID=409290 RepID=A0A3N0BSJ6_9MICC|nr:MULTISPECIES: hypothetical protein [Arthrobacter]QYF90599.1 hypothetical protein KY499_04725 [Arthrobacter sp. PAMC25284]RNL51601.1 hypothetical protein D7003_15855 [Arthrobacter oryzae]
MVILFNIVVFLHIVGAAMVVGIWIGHLKTPIVHPRQFDGAMLSILTGIALMGLLPILHNQDPSEFGDPNYFKLGIKFAIGLGVGVLAFIGRRKFKKGEKIELSMAHGVGGLGLLNIAIATLWQ